MFDHAIASADWSLNHPALCFECGDGEQFVPHDIIQPGLQQERLCVALWQTNLITFLDIKHTPSRTFTDGYMAPGDRPEGNWCVLQRYMYNRHGAIFCNMEENIDPRPVVRTLSKVLATPLGFPPDSQGLIPDDLVLERVIMEFPDYRETRAVPLDTSISLLAAIASQDYLNTIYGRTRV
jgi:hypothetical protein